MKFWRRLGLRVAGFATAALLLFGVSPSPVYAQRLNFKVYKPSDGLPQSQVLSLYQDSKGYLWFGTYSGVSRYNGVKFETFDKSSGMSSYTIRCIGEDAEGRFYFGTQGGGLNIWDGERFEHRYLEEGDVSDAIRALLIDSKGGVWLGTTDGLFCLRGDDVSVYRTENGLPSNFCFSLFQDRSGVIWVGTSNGAAYLEGDKFVSPALDFEEGSKRVQGIVQDNSGTLWFALPGRLMQLKDSRMESVDLPPDLPRMVFLCGAVDAEGEIWFGSDVGVVRYAKGRFRHYTTRNGLGDNNIHCILVDHEGNIWFGTDNGASKLSKGPFVHYNMDPGLAGPLFKDSRNRIWVGNYDKITVFDGEDTWSLTAADGLTNPVVNALAEDRDGSIYIGTTTSLLKWDGHNITTVRGDSGVLSLLRDKSGRVWIGGIGLSFLEGGGISNLPSDNPLSKLFVDEIEEDLAGRIWIGTRTAGCFIFDGHKYSPFGKEVGLDKLNVGAFAFDAKRRVWIGTRGDGAFCWDGKDFGHFTTANGLSSNFVWTILADSDGNVWFCTNRGIDRYDGKGFRNFNSRDGLAAEEGVTNSAVEDDKKRLWFGSVEGLNLYTKELTIVNRVPPPVYIERMSVNGGPVEIAAGLELGPNENDILFEYVGLSFRNERGVRFRHKLEGLDKEWSQETYEHSVRYASLPPGNYVFWVEACNDAGVWSDSPAVVHFVIDPPIYLSWWFVSLSISCIALLGVLAHRLRLQLIRREKKVLEERVRERTRELTTANAESKAFSYSVSHDLRNPLWRMRGYLQVLKGEYEERLERAGVEILDKADRAGQEMQDIIGALLQLSRLSKEELVVRPVDLSGLAREIVEYLKRIQPNRNASVEIQEGVTATGDLGLLRQLLENLIGNAWKFTAGRDPAVIQFGARQQGRDTVYYVRDNGVGFDMADYEKLFVPFRRLHPPEQFEGTGIGLATVKRIVDRHKGRIWAEGADGNGATFYFTLS